MDLLLHPSVAVMENRNWRVGFVCTAIADWHYFAIIELTGLADFQPDPQWIANRLGIDKKQMESSIARLLRLEVIEVTPDGFYRKTEDYRTAPIGLPSRAIKSYH